MVQKFAVGGHQKGSGFIEGPGHSLMMETPEQFNAQLGLIVAEMSETS